MHFEFRKSQRVCITILARTLGIPWTWTRGKVFRKMGFSCLSDGATIQRNRSLRFHKCQYFESWKNEENTELLFQRISSVFTEQSQMGVNCWVEEQSRKRRTLISRHKNLNSRILTSVDSQEANSLMRESGKPRASENRLREGLQDFESLHELFSSNRSVKRRGFIIE